MKEMEKKKLEKFLKGLAKLTKKYGLEICGCGCCRSPWIADKDYNRYMENLTYDSEKQIYFEDND